MSNARAPGGSAPQLTVPHRDAVAGELTSAIHGDDSDALRRLLAERPQLASARMIGRKEHQGRLAHPPAAPLTGPATSPPHPPRSPSRPTPGLTPTTTLAPVAPKRRCTAPPAATTLMSPSRRSMTAPSSKHRMARSAPSPTTRSATPTGTPPGSWSSDAPRSTSPGTKRHSEWSNRSSNYSRSRLTRPANFPKRPGTLALRASDALPSIYSLKQPIST
jgi:hypothetical protein